MSEEEYNGLDDDDCEDDDCEDDDVEFDDDSDSDS